MITLTLSWRALVHLLVANSHLAEQHLVAAVESGTNLDSLKAVQGRVWSELKSLGLAEGVDAHTIAISIMELENTGKMTQYSDKQLDLTTLNPLLLCYGTNPLAGVFPIDNATEEIGFQIGSGNIRVM